MAAALVLDTDMPITTKAVDLRVSSPERLPPRLAELFDDLAVREYSVRADRSDWVWGVHCAAGPGGRDDPERRGDAGGAAGKTFYPTHVPRRDADDGEVRVRERWDAGKAPGSVCKGPGASTGSDKGDPGMERRPPTWRTGWRLFVASGETGCSPSAEVRAAPAGAEVGLDGAELCAVVVVGPEGYRSLGEGVPQQ